MPAMQGKRVLLGVTGGIAAYKSPDLVRRLREQGAEVQVVLTAGAREFVTPMTFQAVSGREVRSDLWDPESAKPLLEHYLQMSLEQIDQKYQAYVRRLASDRRYEP